MELSRLEEWYAARCNGEWEHGSGIHIETLDNPGWRVKIALHDTSKESRTLQRQTIQRENEHDWIHYCSEDRTFHIACGPKNLSESLDIFLLWFDSD
jgi:hypothetical protein